MNYHREVQVRKACRALAEQSRRIAEREVEGDYPAEEHERDEQELVRRHRALVFWRGATDEDPWARLRGLLDELRREINR